MPNDIDPVPTVPLSELRWSNRRSIKRELCHLACPARVSRQGEDWWLAWVHDLSTAGVGLLVGEPMDLGTELNIELLTQSIARVPVRGRVVHATPGREGNWIVGCAFFQTLTHEELEKLL